MRMVRSRADGERIIARSGRERQALLPPQSASAPATIEFNPRGVVLVAGPRNNPPRPCLFPRRSDNASNDRSGQKRKSREHAASASPLKAHIALGHANQIFRRRLNRQLSSSMIGSIDLDPCLPNDHSRPIDIGFDLGGKFPRRTADRSKPEHREAFLRLRPGNELRHPARQEVHD